VAEPNVHPRSAVHEHDADPEPYVRASRGRAGDSLTEPGATIIDLTKRSQARIAERWGKPIVEPEPDASYDPENPPARLVDAANHLHFYRDPSPSMKAVLADMAEGAEKLGEVAPWLLVFYWPLAAVGAVIVFGGKHAQEIGARPGRLGAAGVIALLLLGALAIAGINPIP
jgi:hypothetical protein